MRSKIYDNLSRALATTLRRVGRDLS